MSETCTLSLGPKCRVKGAQPELVLALEVVRSQAEKLGIQRVIVGHVVDGTHSDGSLHYAGAAADMVLFPAEDNEYELVANAIRSSLGQDFDVLNESRHTPNQHIHIEFQPKRPLNL